MIQKILSNLDNVDKISDISDDLHYFDTDEYFDIRNNLDKFVSNSNFKNDIIK